MSELENIKEEKLFILYKGEQKEIRYGFRAWGLLVEKYGSLDDFMNKFEKEISENPFISIPELLWVGLTDKEGINKEEFLDLPDYSFSSEDIELLSNIIITAMNKALPKETEQKKTNATKKK